MCYSAMVEQNAKNLGIKFQARVQIDMYDTLFARRLRGEKILINKAMEFQFTHGAKSPEEMAIAEKIKAWHEAQLPGLERALFAQKKRLADADRSLKTKETKKAKDDKRIATKKVEKFLQDIEKHKTTAILSENEERIFPNHYMSLLALNESGEKVIMPVRYLLRPSNKDETFDQKFGGCYNARLDSLDRVAWWKSALGKRHGIILVKKFYENVEGENYLPGHKLAEEFRTKKNIVLCFEPEGHEYMVIPCLWDKWEKKGEPSLFSAALITDDPPADIYQTGHDRTPIFLKESVVDEWLTAKGTTLNELNPILDQRERPSYSHRVVGAA